ncbi:MAG TPA: hypothetical protein VNR89_08165 [Roseomonas sp.]|nr:hypothetical protein [Roseomonas sp.]
MATPPWCACSPPARARAVMDHVEAVIRAGRGLLAGEGQAA